MAEKKEELKFFAKDFYQDEKVARTYDGNRFTSPKGRILDRAEKRALKKALTLLSVKGPVLDIPCGTGRITEFLLQEGYTTAGFDISREMLEVAQGRLGGYRNLLDLGRANAEDLPFVPGWFECVTSIRLMGHVPPSIRVKLLREMGRVGGHVIASFSISNPFLRLRRKVKSLLRQSSVLYPATMAEIRTEAEDAGLKLRKLIWVLPFLSEEAVLIFSKQ